MTSPQGFLPVIAPADPAHRSRRLPWAEVLSWTLPALVVGLVLRGVLMWQMPYGLFLPGPSAALVLDVGRDHSLLASAIYAVPFLVGLIALIFIPIVQHILGLSVIFAAGLLCHTWFRRWRLFIFPITFFFAVNPHFLNAEHTLVSNSIFLWTSMLLALAGTLYLRRPTYVFLTFLCGALVLQAMAAPWGRTFFLFGFILVYLLHRREWAWLVPRFLVLAIVCAIAWPALRGPHAGLNLFTGVLRLAPDNLSLSPDASAAVRELRDRKPENRERNASVLSALLERLQGETVTPREADRFALHLGLEIAARQAHRLPGLLVSRFLAEFGRAPLAPMRADHIVDVQWRAYREHVATLGDTTGGLIGTQPRGLAEVKRFIAGNYHPDRVEWMARWQEIWQDLFWGLRLEDTEDGEGVVRMGMPAHLAVGLLGLAGAMVFPSRMRPLHIAWGAGVVFAMSALFLGAASGAPFAYAMSGFIWLYLLLAIDLVARIPWPGIGAGEN